jgi:hypothetical protein
MHEASLMLLPAVRKIKHIIIVEIIKLKHKKEARILNNMYIMSA